MIDRIIKIISILSFLMSISMAAFGYVAIRYMQSPEFERTLKNKLIGSIQQKLPDVIEKTIPDLTGPSIPLPKKQLTIPEVKIHEIKIPTINNWYFEPPVINKVPKPIVDYPACVKVHRNNLVNQIDIDENGTIIKCGVKMPSYTPLEYTPSEFTFITPPKNNNSPKSPPPKEADLSKIKKDVEEFFIKCPSDTDPKIGNFANDLKLDKVVGHRLSEDGKTCITLYEPSTFIEKWIPSGPVLVNTSIIAITAASSPILANLLKGVIKNLIKKLQKKQKK